MEKRYIIIYVTDEYSKKVGSRFSYLYEYDAHKVEIKNVGNKQMVMVSKKSGEMELLIDVDSVVAVDSNTTLALYTKK